MLKSEQLFLPFPSAAEVVGGAMLYSRKRRGFAVLNPVGEYYNLVEILEELNQKFFDGTVDVKITWGRGRPKSRRRRVRRRHITLGSYFDKEKLIVIHPKLDEARVPRFMVESIVYHEMCHQVVREEKRNGRRRLHTPEFKKLETGYPEFLQARTWARENASWLVG